MVYNMKAHTLTQVEKLISDRYGDKGLVVYNLVDGNNAATEIMHQTGFTQGEVVEILGFLDAHGIIALNYPPR